MKWYAAIGTALLLGLLLIGCGGQSENTKKAATPETQSSPSCQRATGEEQTTFALKLHEEGYAKYFGSTESEARLALHNNILEYTVCRPVAMVPTDQLDISMSCPSVPLEWWGDFFAIAGEATKAEDVPEDLRNPSPAKLVQAYQTPKASYFC